MPIPWTLSFIKDWWPSMRFRSILRLRDYEIRHRQNQLKPGALLRLDLVSPVNAQVTIREIGSDSLTFQEVLKDQVYRDVLGRISQCHSVIDLGANIGLASLYFANCYPSSHVLAVEPNPDNYSLLQDNLGVLIKAGRCRTLGAAVWGTAKKLVMVEPDANHYSAFTTKEAEDPNELKHSVAGMTIAQIIEQSGFASVDILKIDIEGAETELFKGNLDWLEVVRAIAIEFHGSSRSESNFDNIMRDHGFHVYDDSPHTVLAVKNQEW